MKSKKHVRIIRSVKLENSETYRLVWLWNYLTERCKQEKELEK